MKRTLVSLGAFFLVAALIYISIFIFDPGMYVETAFVIIVYPSIAVGIITAVVWRPKHRRG
ncbi:hypothetical protein [Massilia alkalitolerans]|jgi:hypothetical protein|uniref:hypothetical protein n=1 Tax=Massilia alkalitolerans TaxID=286638 RepID=UPI0004896681|nr:hypothetical protein [Massilia alkalitolerans]